MVTKHVQLVNTFQERSFSDVMMFQFFSFHVAPGAISYLGFMQKKMKNLFLRIFSSFIFKSCAQG